MGEKSKIGWTDGTSNPWIGCSGVSPGCANCYAKTFVEGRLKQDFKVRRPTKGALKDVLRWNKKPWVCDGCGEAYMWIGCPEIAALCKTPKCKNAKMHRRRVFVGSMMDWLDENAPMEQFVALLDAVRVCTNLDFLMLTKRPENWNSRLVQAMALVDDAWFHGEEESRPELGEWIGRWIEAQYPHRAMGQVPANVWFGVTVEDQKHADKRIPLLLDIPAKVRFVSYEPALEAVDFNRILLKKSDAPERSKPDVCMQALNGWHGGANRPDKTKIDWIIVGGESGVEARPFNVEWARSTVQQCKAAGISCFVKQMGSNCHTPNRFVGKFPPGVILHDERIVLLKAKKGDNPAEWPEDLRVQQWPEVVR